MTTTPELTKGQVALLATSPQARPRRVTVLERRADRLDVTSVDGEPIPTAWAEHHTLHLTYVDDSGVETVEVPVIGFDGPRVVIGPPNVGARVHRRAFTRVRAKLPVNCLIVDDQFTRFEPLPASVRDVGGGGVGLVCRSGFPRGARVVVAIALSDSHVVALGTVVGTSTDGKDHVVHV
ncbi:MAG TPA: PilZ domain-containing protein, partial [Acidimicrobiia bacterium]|nr:PilZ domain-containing protein [Acidimicrobiia bacterium]